MPPPQKIIELVERFDQYNLIYTSNSYNETQVRREFIDPFFTALGWDVDNKQGLDERYKEVIHEDAVKVGGKTKAPDYSFRISGVRKFFVEAKKPAVNLKKNPEPAYQLRRYAWSAQLPISILTDFEEFIVYDCTKKPSIKDKSSLGRIKYYTYKDYIEKWDEIESIFSLAAIPEGKFNDLADSLVKKKGGKGTAGIDDAFLAEIEGWRDILAKNIAIRNMDLSVRELNLAVQKIIDRILFLRICEDRSIEEYGQLKKIAEGKDVYKSLIDVFIHADDKYDSGLFHFRKEDGMEEPDILTTSLIIDDKTFKHIIKNLYYPESPYEFSVFPSDILGQVYEQFLGKVIRLTASHQAKVEEKPEVKKAGGVFYTPTYIVDYIVKNTVGKLVEDKTPKDISELKVLDPACGSGSFLIGAYQHLLDWHVNWYMDNLVPLMKEGKAATDKEVLKLLPVKPATKKKGRGRKRTVGSDYNFPIYQMSEDDWRLTSDEKKRILVNNIYGVDIDQQAVEVTKLSLLLKVLEGEKGERISKQLTITQERVLPSLNENIKCGNSLIGPDIYSDVQMTLDDDNEFYRINAFDWNREFSDIFEKGGFDAIIGNPPYVRQEILGEEFKTYAQKYYETYVGTADLYVYFIEKTNTILKESGLLGIICSNKFMKAKYGTNLRNYIVNNMKLIEIIDFGELPVFQNASTFPAILLIQSKSEKEQKFIYTPIKTLAYTSLYDEVKKIGFNLNNKSLDKGNWILSSSKEIEIIEKMDKIGISLEKYVAGEIYRGILTGYNEAFLIDEPTKNALIEKDENNYEIIKKFLVGDDVRKYNINSKNRFLIFTRRGVDIDKYPTIKSYLEVHKDRLMPKPKNWKGEKWGGRKSGSYQWYEIQDTTGYYREFEKPKIIFPNIAKEPRFTFDNLNYYSNQKTYIIPKDDKYLLGVLNSTLMWLFLKRTCTCLGDPDKRGRLELSAIYIYKVPIRTIDSSNPEDVTKHDKVVSLVEQMLELHKKLGNAKLSSEKEMIQRRIDATDEEIDRLVYDLYGLTDEEIKIVEGSCS